MRIAAGCVRMAARRMKIARIIFHAVRLRHLVVCFSITLDWFECIGQRRSAWCRTAELSEQADSETPRRLPHATYVLHRPGCAQAQDQLLRERPAWCDSLRRIDSRDTF